MACQTYYFEIAEISNNPFKLYTFLTKPSFKYYFYIEEIYTKPVLILSYAIPILASDT